MHPGIALEDCELAIQVQQNFVSFVCIIRGATTILIKLGNGCSIS